MQKMKVFAAGLAMAALAAAPAQAMAQDGGVTLRGGITNYSSTVEFLGLSESSGSKLGFAAGISLHRPLSSVFSIQPEVLFVQKGGEDDDPDLGLAEFTLNYVDIPVHFRVDIPLDGNARPFVTAAPFVGYLVSASDTDTDEDPKDFLKDFNYGLVIGGGVEFGRLSVQVGYDMGRANILDDDEFQDELDDFFGGGSLNFTTSGFVLTGGIRF